jgi:secreted trypsin-like serine protease
MSRSVVALAVVAALFASSPSGAVVGGSPADEGEYPWMAAIYSGSSPSNGQYCGGSLVAPRLVVTAAHCVNELLDNTIAGLPTDLRGLKVKVMLGSSRLTGTAGERITAKRLTRHPSSDVAVIELVEASAQQPIAFARPGDEALYTHGTTATVTGWGATSEGGSGSNRLLEAVVPMVSDEACAAAYGGFDAATETCAGYEEGGVDTCQGDSGGPLMVPGEGASFLLVGATSWGDGCARPGKPGVYAEIAPVAAFIERFIA